MRIQLYVRKMSEKLLLLLPHGKSKNNAKNEIIACVVADTKLTEQSCSKLISTTARNCVVEGSGIFGTLLIINSTTRDENHNH